MKDLFKFEFNVLGIEKLAKLIFDVTGLTAYGKRKNAEAENEIAENKAISEGRIQQIRLSNDDRIKTYISKREEQKFNNVDSVFSNAREIISREKSISSDSVSVDWMNRFLSIVETISDETLQKLWGSILAGEVKQPNSYSMRTLEVLKNVSKSEAELFIKAVHFNIDGVCICTDSTLNLSEILILEEIGFINPTDLVRHIKLEAHQKSIFKLDNRFSLILYNSTDKSLEFDITVRQLSKTGREMLQLIEIDESKRKEFYHDLTTLIKGKGVSVS